MKERGRKEKREKHRRIREKGKDRRGRREGGKEGRREGGVQGQAKWIVTRCDRRKESHSDNRVYKKCR